MFKSFSVDCFLRTESNSFYSVLFSRMISKEHLIENFNRAKKKSRDRRRAFTTNNSVPFGNLLYEPQEKTRAFHLKSGKPPPFATNILTVVYRIQMKQT